MFTAVFGRRGSGKTTLIRALIPNLRKPVVVIDVLGNFQGYGHGTEDWLDVESIRDALEAVRAYCEAPDENPSVVVLTSGDLDNAIDFVCSALWKIQGGTLVIDETDAFSLAEAPCYDEAIRYGRNRDIDMVIGCRRPAEISKNITAASDRVYCFVTREPRDIDYYCEFLGDEIALQIPHLKPHHGMFVDFLEQKQGVFRTDIDGHIYHVKNTCKNDDAPSKSELDLTVKDNPKPPASNIEADDDQDL